MVSENNTRYQNFTVTGLPNDCTTYIFSVAGFNINGTGPFRNRFITKSCKMHRVLASYKKSELVDLFFILYSYDFF